MTILDFVHIFMSLHRRCREALCFLGCPSVRPDFRPDLCPDFFCLRDNSSITLMEFHQTWYRGPPPGVDELIRFWARSAQRQGSKVNELGINMLFLPRLRDNSSIT